MTHQQATRRIEIKNRQGLHARPADAFVKLANQFQSEIEIERDTLRVSGKSILDLLTLVAEQGVQLTIIANGPDAEAAVDALAALVDSFVEEDEQPDTQPD